MAITIENISHQNVEVCDLLNEVGLSDKPIILYL